MAHFGAETIRTYRYVRLSIVAAVLLLFIALLLQMVRDPQIRGSISAYYYSPVRSIFVGTLIAAAFLLVAIRGRRGGEDVLLDLAGMLLPLVALIPTPLAETEAAPCPRGGKCVPEEFVPGVEVGVFALLLLGFVVLVLVGWAFVRQRRHAHSSDRATRWGFAAACVVWAVFAVWFGPTRDWALREQLLDIGHYAAAIPMFALIVVVALINARNSQRGIRVARFQASFKAIYRVVALGMGIVLVGAFVYWIAFIRPDPDAESAVIFWVEAWLLTLFAIFWVAQTAEFWHEGLPAEAREPESPVHG